VPGTRRQPARLIAVAACDLPMIVHDHALRAERPAANGQCEDLPLELLTTAETAY
jgi:hypothetical protein